MTTTVSFKEFSEREAISLAKSCPGSLLEDKEFPPSPSSLFIDPSRPAHPPSQVAAWKRSREISPQAELFVDGASSGDVCQGALGDCWFIGALAVIATRWDLLKELIVSTHPELGFYQFRFWKSDRWITVTIDDRIPCRADGIPIYAHCSNKSEMWVPMIEKAYAKLHGSYEALSGGSISYAFVDLSGGASEKINFQSLVAENKLWNNLKWYLEEAWLMGSAVSADGKTEGDNGKGILIKHAYSLLDAQEVDRTKLVHLRNPWGNTDWRGAWADSDRRWTPELLKRLNHTLDNNDGDFWMSLEDYQTNFNRIYLCRLYNDSIGGVWDRHQFKLEWKGPTAGGCMNHASWVKNTQFAIRPKKDTPVFVSLLQNDTRFTGLPSTDIGVYLLETDDCTVQKTRPDRIVASSGTFSDDREATLSVDLLAGHQYVGFGCTFQPGFESKYIITIYSKYPVDVDLITSSGVVSEASVPFCAPGDSHYVTTKDKSKRNNKPPKTYRNKKPQGVVTPTPASAPFPSSPSPAKPQSPAQRPSPAAPSPSPAGGRMVQPAAVQPPEPGHVKQFVVQRPESVDPSTVHTVKLSNGDIYFGQLRDSKKHGVGKYMFADGDVYIGGFYADEQEGVGEYLFASGDRYVGEVHNSKFEGQGVYTFVNGDVYEGEFKGGIRHGVGVFKYRDGSVYKGHYVKGAREGYGVFTHKDGSRYEGEFRDSKPNGQGTFYFSNGSIYRGRFKDDQFEDPEATYEAANGDVYVGGYAHGEKNGKGTLKSARGWTYVGQFKNGQMEGHGEYTYASGDRYVGEFKNSQFNGQGTYTFKSGAESLVGFFRDGKFSS